MHRHKRMKTKMNNNNTAAAAADVIRPEMGDSDQLLEHLVNIVLKLITVIEGLAADDAAVARPHLSSLEYMTAYSTVHDLCTSKSTQDHAAYFYGLYKNILVDYLKTSVLPSLRQRHHHFFLMEIGARWISYRVMIRCLTNLFCYVDRYYIPKKNLPSLRLTGLNSFRDWVYHEVNGKARDAIIALINKERDGEQQVNRALLKNVIGMFIELDEMEGLSLYQQDFEEYLLQDTSAYYSRKSSDWIQHHSCADYLLKSEEGLEKEKEIVSHYLHRSSEPKLVESFQHHVLVVHQTDLLQKEDSGCRALLRDAKTADLSRMFRLYHKVPQGLEPVALIFKQHITDIGTTLINQTEDGTADSRLAARGGEQQQDLVTKILELHDKYMAYVTDYFGNHTLFHKALKEAFEAFCNKGIAGCTSAEVLASFCDNVLRKAGTQNSMSDEASEETLEKAVNLLVYVNDKDVFAEFYKKKLARRLLFDRNSNFDLERIILTKMKQQSGGHFTSKMEGMVTDVILAKENQTSFQEYLSSNDQAISPGIDFSVTVLTTGLWPTYKSFDLLLPAEMVKCVEVYKEYYAKETKHRKITWVFSLGTCNLNGNFAQKTIELIVTTQQAAALMLFNASDRLSYLEIKTQLNMNDDDLVRVLHSLSCAKNKILSKEPAATKTISENDCFQFNYKFTDRMRRIRIPLPPVDDRKKVMEDVTIDRRYAIDAAIVRIMKNRKVLNYQQLVLECVEQLSRLFQPDIKAMKKRIEDLISRDYLQRDNQDSNTLRYVA